MTELHTRTLEFNVRFKIRVLTVLLPFFVCFRLQIPHFSIKRYENIFCWKRWILLYFFSRETPCHFWGHERNQPATALRISFFGKIICSKKKDRSFFLWMERLSSRLFNQIQFLCKDAEVALFPPNIIFPVMAAGRNNLLPWLCSGSGSGVGTELTFFCEFNQLFEWYKLTQMTSCISLR